MNPKNSRELKELKETWIYSREALVEAMEGKKLRKRVKEDKFHKSEEKRENIEALYERLKMNALPKEKYLVIISP